MLKSRFKKLKPIIYISLFFFIWANAGFYKIVYAATEGRDRGSEARGQKKGKTTEKRFEEALESLRKRAKKAEEKVKRGEDVAEEEIEIENYELEIDILDHYCPVKLSNKFNCLGMS